MTPCSDVKISKLDSDDREGHSPPVITNISSAIVTNYHSIDHRLITKGSTISENQLLCFFLFVPSLIGFRWLQYQIDTSCTE